LKRQRRRANVKELFARCLYFLILDSGKRTTWDGAHTDAIDSACRLLEIPPVLEPFRCEDSLIYLDGNEDALEALASLITLKGIR
jgi:hypothetical protein